MTLRCRSAPLVLITATVAFLGGSPSALAQDSGAPAITPQQTTAPEATPAAMPAKPNGGKSHGGESHRPELSLRLGGLKGGDLTVGNKIKAKGTVRPFIPGQKVTVLLKRGKKTVKRTKTFVHRKGKKGSTAKFGFSQRLIRPGRYSVQAVVPKTPKRPGAKDSSPNFHIRYPDLGPGDSGSAVKIFNKLLGDLGYVNDEGATYDSATGRAVLAFHKVNKEARKESSSSGMFKKLAKGKGGFKLKHPGAGKHVETDISRQVMVLAKGGKVDEIYTISSGKSTTPTILGKFRFYRKEPGYNNLEMYYSVYFLRGYATHGYASVPDYPASHGCLRNPIPDSVHIYNWIDIGDPIYVYH